MPVIKKKTVYFMGVAALLVITAAYRGVARAQEPSPSSAPSTHVPTVTRPGQFAISPRLQPDDSNATGVIADTDRNDGQSDQSDDRSAPWSQERIQFDGLGANGASDGLSDSNIAVGPGHVVQMVNNEYAVYDKHGHILPGYPLKAGTVWQALGAPCNADNGADPIVQYDRLADRWLLSQTMKGPYAECIAISITADPTGRYALYAYDFGSTGSDWPKFGVWPTVRNSAY